MMMPPLRAGMTELSLENEDHRTGWRPSIIKSGGEPLFGTVSSTLFGTGEGEARHSNGVSEKGITADCRRWG
jgi:hypothetical protein